MAGKYYLTTPLYYVNSKPHIGHSYTQVAADTLARYQRMRMGKENVYFLTGTDEHGQKIDRAAQLAGMETKIFVDKISGTFKDLWTKLNISYDRFIRTTDEDHKKAVEKVWDNIQNAKVVVDGKEMPVIYPYHYDGFYCVSCETFITEGLLDPNNPTLCPDCKRPLERMEEDTYFLRISAYQDRLMKDISDGNMAILPNTRRNEVLGFLQHNKLKDLSISRPKNRLSWGIPLPFDDQHVTYVWFDALINYISACGYGDDKKWKNQKWWPADLHIIGKDIIRHHAVLWPILLYALDLELPELIFAHGWWVQGGEKMSKSRGNVIDPEEIAKVYGVDAYRYFMLRETPFGEDGTFSEEALISRYNADLANNIGNLLSRTVTMCEKYFAGTIPGFPNLPDSSPMIDELRETKAKAYKLFEKVDQCVQVLDFSGALTEIWNLIDDANKFIENKSPWTLFKEKKMDELQYVIITLAELLKVIAQLIYPFMPSTAESIWKQLGLKSSIDKLHVQSAAWEYTMFGLQMAKGEALFPRIDVKKYRIG